MKYGTGCYIGFEYDNGGTDPSLKETVESVIPFTEKHEPKKLTCYQLCGFIAQFVRAQCTGILEVVGSIPVEVT